MEHLFVYRHYSHAGYRMQSLTQGFYKARRFILNPEGEDFQAANLVK
jgi:hypothetical protein